MTRPNERDPRTAANIALWLNGHYDETTKKSILQLIQENPEELINAFYTHLTFGTGGMRGLMGIGTNRINEYTIRAATQGLANYINKQLQPPQGHSAFIGFDSRRNSRLFAEEAAKVLAANGIHVFLCKNIRPTPLVSFGCRLKKCTAGIMITASHNPAEYNGYKVYWSDGGQVSSPHDVGIMEEVAIITDPTMVKSVENVKHPMIDIVCEEVDDHYLVEGSKLQNYPEVNEREGKTLKVVYTSLHGTGITIVPKMLTQWGFSNLSLVDSQVVPDGSFPTTKFPNPEEKAALAEGIKKLETTQSDLLIATDPDADRVGVAVLHQGAIVQLNGNQIACLCLQHICEALTRQNRMPEKGAFVKTIVTTELFTSICNHYKKPCMDVLTGFKYIAEIIRNWETDPEGLQYVFGAEESYGYLYGTLTRDKDAVIASALICEVALQTKKQGKTLVDRLQDLFRTYGFYAEKVISVIFEEGKAGKENMLQSMERLRKHAPSTIGGIEVLAIEDYLSSIRLKLRTGEKETISLPTSNVLLFRLADGSKLVVRPSGTEPKIKLYCEVVADESKSSQEKVLHLLNHLKNLIK